MKLQEGKEKEGKTYQEQGDSRTSIRKKRGQEKRKMDTDYELTCPPKQICACKTQAGASVSNSL